MVYPPPLLFFFQNISCIIVAVVVIIVIITFFISNIPVGICNTAGFVRYRIVYGSVSVYTGHGYSVWGYRYGVAKPDPRYTRVEP